MLTDFETRCRNVQDEIDDFNQMNADAAYYGKIILCAILLFVVCMVGKIINDFTYYNLITIIPSEKKEIKEESRKIGKQILNTVMTKKTLSFDKLYARVIKENYGMNNMEDAEDDSIAALGLEDEPMDDEFGGAEGGDDEEVTITMPKSLAQQFHNIFAEVLDDNLEGDFGGEDDGDEGDDLDFGGDDDGEYGENEEDEEGEASELPSTAGHSLTGRKNTVGGALGKAKKSSASAKVTDEVGTKENFGTNVNMGTGSGNKVGKAYKPGSGYFQ
jgi:hypothetical protein